MKTADYFTDWQLSRKLYLRQSTYEAEYIYFTRHIVPYFAAAAPDLENITYSLKHSNSLMSDYLFCRADGTVMRPDTLTRSFQRELKKHNLPAMRFHDLRHSTASILFDRGWNLEDVKSWLGHSDIETTSNIYLHYGRTRKILLAKDIEGMFKLKSKN